MLAKSSLDLWRRIGICRPGRGGIGRRGLWMRLSMRNWMPVASMARAIRPPRASISRTIWPLARPPMAGLQDMRPMARGSMVTMATLPAVGASMCEAAQAASAPAWPPPMMMMSKDSAMERPEYHVWPQNSAHSISTQFPPIPRSTFSGTFSFIAPSISARTTSDHSLAPILAAFKDQFIMNLHQHADFFRVAANLLVDVAPSPA